MWGDTLSFVVFGKYTKEYKILKVKRPIIGMKGAIKNEMLRGVSSKIKTVMAVKIISGLKYRKNDKNLIQSAGNILSVPKMFFTYVISDSLG